VERVVTAVEKLRRTAMLAVPGGQVAELMLPMVALQASLVTWARLGQPIDLGLRLGAGLVLASQLAVPFLALLGWRAAPPSVPTLPVTPSYRLFARMVGVSVFAAAGALLAAAVSVAAHGLHAVAFRGVEPARMFQWIGPVSILAGWLATVAVYAVLETAWRREIQVAAVSVPLLAILPAHWTGLLDRPLGALLVVGPLAVAGIAALVVPGQPRHRSTRKAAAPLVFRPGRDPRVQLRRAALGRLPLLV
jgi:hypothetical protein